MRVLFGVTGSVAAHRGLEAARLVAKAGHIVKCILTRNATEFIRPLAFRALVGETYTDEDFFRGTIHIELSSWSDCRVVAPATANIMAKVARGIADDLLSTTLLAAGPPVIFFPGMHESMWLAPATQDNIALLAAQGHMVMEPIAGDLSSGRGIGRMRSPEDIASCIQEWASVLDSLKGKRVLIAYGPTAEPIDPVRVITNLSSGRMGVEICRAARAARAFVTAVRGPGVPIAPAHDSYAIKTAHELWELLARLVPEHDVVVMAVAVADFRPKDVSGKKIKRKGNLVLEMEPNPDILAGLPRKQGQVFVGFCLAEERGLFEKAREKMRSKRVDLMVANDISSPGADEAHFILITKRKTVDLGIVSKASAAFSIIREIARIIG
ncbi:MAG: bifunctional phosphopantothenoylcysteine decarboxylase/phosphopantothenate--cysteine ligase CoaBC [candidate division WOR-3 bacterium]